MIALCVDIGWYWLTVLTSTMMIVGERFASDLYQQLLGMKVQKQQTNARPAPFGLTNSNGLIRRKELQASAVSST